MNEIRRTTLGAIVTGTALAGCGYLILPLLGDTHTRCGSPPGPDLPAAGTAPSARCHAVDLAFQFRPFLLWLGLFVLACGIVVKVLGRVDGEPDAPASALPGGGGLPPHEWPDPAAAASAIALAHATVRMLAAGDTTAPDAVREQVDDLLDRQLREVEPDGGLDTFWTDPIDRVNRRALVEAVARRAEDDPDFLRQLRAYVDAHRPAGPGH
ncbi:hypothetical protein [Polymorphospora sp. NPDC050346]|uniref:hypothetical protein n=1 Tax=Polymorphospora sp. NPDC050346 TaxID=3155780 RepID=UPI003400B500